VKNPRHKAKEGDNSGKQQHFRQNPMLNCLQTFSVIGRRKEERKISAKSQKFN
jgi:hypothetical protein